VLRLLVTLLAFSAVSIGCAKTIVLHPVTDEDIRIEGDWVCMSQDYVREVMKARLGE
jgi:hypothetical protein